VEGQRWNSKDGGPKVEGLRRECQEWRTKGRRAKGWRTKVKEQRWRAKDGGLRGGGPKAKGQRLECQNGRYKLEAKGRKSQS
jgi:hypothetical protein